MAVGTLVHGRSSYENVLCLGLILAEDGRRMSKNLGNILEPIPLMDEHGADALRWFMAASGSPWLPRRVGHAALQEIVRKTLLTYWNTASFLTLYADANDWMPYAAPVPDVADRPALDRWAISELHRLVADVDRLAGDVRHAAGGAAAGGVRRRPVQLVRPAVPATVLERRPGRAGDPARVPARPDAAARADRAVHHRTGVAGRRTPGQRRRSRTRCTWPPGRRWTARSSTTRWPSRSRWCVARWSSGGQRGPSRRFAAASRSGARWSVRPAGPRCRTSSSARSPRSSTSLSFEELAGELVDRSAKGNFRALGKRFGKDTPKVAAAVAAADADGTGRRAARQGRATVLVDGEEVTLAPEDVILTETPREGWAVVTAGGETVALDLTMTEALRRAGLAREVVRLVQEARKAAGFEVSDRIALVWSAEDETAAAIEAHLATICDEVLAVAVERGTPDRRRMAGTRRRPRPGLLRHPFGAVTRQRFHQTMPGLYGKTMA